MKKLLLLISIVIFTTACTNLNKLDYKENINDTIKINQNNKMYNHIGNGYKYYLPKYMSVKNSINYNETINSNDYTYYLYLDIVSYYNKKNINYKEEQDYINYKFSNNGIDGYLKVLEETDKYLVEIIYNYAKIEVKVEKHDLNEAINNSIIILSTIKYDDDVINNVIGENKTNNKEETLNLFDTTKKDENFLDVVEEYDMYEEDESDIPDYDVIN